MHWGVLLAGGSGTRFWPLSSPSRPKQLLPLAGSRSSAEEAVDRLAGFIPPERILVVTGAALAPPLQAALPVPHANYLIEPRAASTGPALVWATVEALRRDPDAGVISMHADWAIRDPSAFVATAATALDTAARHARLVTVGMVPSRPETGFGYIVPGEPLDGAARSVARFIEKPDAARALDLMADGALWNSGLFAWRAQDLLREVRLHTPEIATGLPALEAGDPIAFFEGVRAVSIDVGVFERSEAIAVVPGDFPWDDIGTWEALARVRPRDRRGNVVHGAVTLVECSDCIVWNDGPPLVLSGVRDLVVVHANQRTLVLDRARAPHLKHTLDALPEGVRDLE
ncbi:MAG: mannose-1-phosphate guanylyltransferase [Gemmatimonadetes bacterium]|nr:mannose-1-phosphate guanylyltransferase [Gemmatimonadota bacterium]MCB9504936.1 mannose-1-phosphate guanylyltransferase [Gemmatimonadales bacterium]MCB9518255.1 mannose-1-phosphate guanylyltransferase [Gemmatimonadales bacterium]HPF62542.1 sugar phosphate nucleotidyltransferase [Gemmatimonadales bacterium]HRX19741.1 sugar phosphate nucleotidyltransferase [Gemmatimonadales bacterium]